jgi:hypothetical protein
MIAWPRRPARIVEELTTTVDVHATLCEVFDVRPEHRTHGHSLVGVLEGTSRSSRTHVLTGIWGREIVYVDDDIKFVRAPREGNRPLEMYSNRWSTMPVHALPGLRLPRPDRRATLAFMPGSQVPVIRQPYGDGDEVPYWARTSSFHGDVRFDRRDDPLEERNLLESGPASRDAPALEAMREALRAIDAPAAQWDRLALT